MSKDKYYSVVVVRNEDVTAAALIYLHGKNNENTEKQDIVTNMEFESIVNSIKITSFSNAWFMFFLK